MLTFVAIAPPVIFLISLAFVYFVMDMLIRSIL